MKNSPQNKQIDFKGMQRSFSNHLYLLPVLQWTNESMSHLEDRLSNVTYGVRTVQSIHRRPL